MGKKIAIIATDFLEQFIKDMITELDMGFQYHIFTYEKFEDIKDIYKKIGPEYDGILASGSFPAHMIRKRSVRLDVLTPMTQPCIVCY